MVVGTGKAADRVVPDTLDLAARAEMALSALIGAIDPNNRYEAFQCGHMDLSPPYMSHRCGGPCLPKPAHVLPMLRLMTGSRWRSDVDEKLVANLLEDIDPDGIWWIRVGGRPWRAETYLNFDQFWPMSHGRLMLALLTWHEVTGDPKWLDVVKRMAGGLIKRSRRQNDRAWVEAVQAHFGLAAWAGGEAPPAHWADQRAKEPDRVDFDGIGVAVRALSRWTAKSGDERALDVAGALVKFMLKPEMWGDKGAYRKDPEVPDGPWSGHFHTRTTGMMGIAEYALAAGDERLQALVRNVYVYAREMGMRRIGFFPAVAGPPEQIKAMNHEAFGGGGQVCEGCAVADMTWLAARLSEEGIGAYWEDVDCYVRNHLVEHQMIHREVIEAILDGAPPHTVDLRMQSVDDVVERNLGSFATCSDPTMLYAWWTMCCNANIPQAMYKVWDAALRFQGGVVRVNLLLNRTSPWMDVESFEPYEGKVVLKNKGARIAFVRIPEWTDRSAVRCRIGERSFSPGFKDGYVEIADLAPGDVVVIEFPLAVRNIAMHDPTYDVTYACRLRGNTVVDISPRAERPHWTRMTDDAGDRFRVERGYPLYQRAHLDTDIAVMKSASPHVAAGLRLP